MCEEGCEHCAVCSACVELVKEVSNCTKTSSMPFKAIFFTSVRIEAALTVCSACVELVKEF